MKTDIMIKGYLQSLRVTFDKVIDIMWEDEEDKDKFHDKDDYRVRMAYYFAKCIEDVVEGNKNDAE